MWVLVKVGCWGANSLRGPLYWYEWMTPSEGSLLGDPAGKGMVTEAHVSTRVNTHKVASPPSKAVSLNRESPWGAYVPNSQAPQGRAQTIRIRPVTTGGNRPTID